MSAILEVRNLVKEYPGVRAVTGVSFSVTPGTCFGLLGPNGAGKTTTVEMMEGICRPTSGQVLYRGLGQGPQFRAEAGIQFQSTALQDFLTVRQTLALFHGLYRQRADLETLIDLCQLRELLERDNRKLSGGQRQRLLLAIALVNDPAIVFLDEPTTGLDPQARRSFWKLVQDIKAQGKTILLTTHYMEEAYVLCDQIAIMDRGGIIAQGSPAALLAAHFDDVILTLPKADFTPAPGPEPVFGAALLDAGELWELSTRDIPAALHALGQAGANLGGLRIRERTLEDLFLELTGRELRA